MINVMLVMLQVKKVARAGLRNPVKVNSCLIYKKFVFWIIMFM